MRLGLARKVSLLLILGCELCKASGVLGRNFDGILKGFSTDFQRISGPSIDPGTV